MKSQADSDGIQSDSFAVVGWERSMVARGQIGSLLLAARTDGKLVYVGSVGTGIKDSEAWKLRGLMDELKSARAPVASSGRRKDITCLKPKLIAEIEYRVWTHDGKLPQASYKGLRERQDNAEVHQLKEPPTVGSS